MRTRITFVICLCLLFAGRASAQWVVSDPGNLAQGIINASKNIIHTSKTATNMVNNFQETVKIYEQGKKYYDALKSVNNLVKDARKVQQTTLSMTDKERMDVVERCHSKMKRYRNLVSYYTNKNISVSYLRAKKKNDLDRIMGLYGSMNERYW